MSRIEDINPDALLEQAMRRAVENPQMASVMGKIADLAIRAHKAEADNARLRLIVEAFERSHGRLPEAILSNIDAQLKQGR